MPPVKDNPDDNEDAIKQFETIKKQCKPLKSLRDIHRLDRQVSSVAFEMMLTQRDKDWLRHLKIEV